MPCRIVILGAGISGLTCAWYLKKKFGSQIELIILEKNQRAGGWIKSERLNGFLFEHGPRSFRTKGSGEYTLNLAQELCLQDQIIFADKSAHIRYLYLNQKLQKVPTTLFSFLTSPLTRNLIFPLFKEPFVSNENNEVDESIYSFISRRWNSNFADHFIDPLISGIYAGDIKKLSLKSCFPHFNELEKKYGSVVKGIWKERKIKKKSKYSSALFSFRNGVETLTNSLINKIDADLKLNSEVLNIQFYTDYISIDLKNQQKIEADYVFSTLSLEGLKTLFKDILPNESLFFFPNSTVKVVHLGYNKNVLDKKGFGYLIPSKEKEDILGCVWDSSVFPQQNYHSEETRLTVMMGGTNHSSKSQFTSEKCLTIALAAVNKHLRIETKPDCVQVIHAQNAIPQYEVGYDNAKITFLQNCNLLSSRLIFLGNAFSGVAVNDCIAKINETIKHFEIN